MPIFPNQYPEKLNPKNEDKLLMADGESGNAIKSVQAKKVADLALPKGGATGQVLTKASNDDFDIEWENKVTTSYSTSEQPTGETWIDGKPIYKKTINFGALPNKTTKAVPHNIAGLFYVIKYETMGQRSTGWQTLPLVYTPIDANYNTDFFITPTNVEISSSQDRSVFTQCYVTIYYTKAED